MARKKKSNPINTRIPFARAYEEKGIIETSSGMFTRMYSLSGTRVENYIEKVFMQKTEYLFNSLPERAIYQFLVHNAPVDEREYLGTVLAAKRNEGYDELIDEYNRVIVDNLHVGHNCVKKKTYFIISVHKNSVDDAAAFFDSVDEDIRRLFTNIYDTKAEALGLMDRLLVMYQLLNPGQNAFANAIDLENNGHPELRNLKYMRMTVKDLLSPKKWNTSPNLLDHTIFNAGTEQERYSRTFFINSIPANVSNSLVTELTNVSGDMVFSMTFKTLDTKLGFDVFSREVAENTIVTRKQKRETIQDKKNHAMLRIETRKETSEDKYFAESALDTTKSAVAGENKIFDTSMTITLYADSLEDLDRNSELLRISAVKFACSVKCLDNQQYEGFCQVLPLALERVSVGRIFSTERMAKLSPISATESIRARGQYHGLNAINDNLVIINRKKNIALSGVICGTEHSGKTYGMKREIFNALISSTDRINVIAYTDEYDELVARLGGEVAAVTADGINPYEMVESYGLTADDSVEKERMLRAYNSFTEGMEAPTDFDADVEPCYSPGTRVRLFKAQNARDVVRFLDYLWNRGIEDKKSGISNQIFVDHADEVIRDFWGAEYLAHYLDRSSAIKNVVTIVVQDSVDLFQSVEYCVSYEHILENTGYVKMFSQGPIERKKYTEILTLNSSLLPYITNVEPGKGLIYTPASNIAFDDNFLEDGNAFSEIFGKKVKQLRYDGK